MQFDRLELLAPNLPALRDFYAERFGLIAHPSPSDHLELQVGTTRLVFTQAPDGWTGRYHFAFNIPENQYQEAKAWLAARVPLAAAADGRDEFWSDDWNADILYFFDPAGNIGELIARHTVACATDAPFGPDSLLAVSEIGLATLDVPATVADLSTRLGIHTYGESSDTFTPLGDEHGLFIVVRTGRIWFPDTGILAEPVPLVATIRNSHGDKHRIETIATDIIITPLVP